MKNIKITEKNVFDSSTEISMEKIAEFIMKKGTGETINLPELLKFSINDSTVIYRDSSSNPSLEHEKEEEELQVRHIYFK